MSARESFVRPQSRSTLRRGCVSFLAALALLGCASPPPPKSQPSPLLGDLMPPFQSTTLSGNPVISGATFTAIFSGLRSAICFGTSSPTINEA